MDDCPYCLSPIHQADETAKCGRCGAKHHAECMLENGGCAAKGCTKQAKGERINVEVDAQPHTMLVLSRESVEQAPSSRPPRNSNPCIKCGKQLPEGKLHCPECAPMVNENQDTRNVGPLLVMVVVVALAVGWIVMTTVGSQPTSTTPLEQGIHTKR